MLLVLTGNTMMQSVRERVPEFAVLKTLGYSDEGVLTLVLSEAVLLCVFAALAGLMIAKLTIPLLKDLYPDFPQLIEMPWAAVLTGFGTAILVACAAALIPAVSVRQLKIVDALAVR